MTMEASGETGKPLRASVILHTEGVGVPAREGVPGMERPLHVVRIWEGEGQRSPWGFGSQRSAG